MNLTKQYPFDSLTVGSYFTVNQRFQHARVAASERARKHNEVYSCRMQDDGSMRVYRVGNDQRPIDQRGSRGKRRIEYNRDPTALQFAEWLASFAVGQSYAMPATYSHLFTAMIAWCELASLRTNRTISAVVQGGLLLITRSA